MSDFQEEYQAKRAEEPIIGDAPPKEHVLLSSAVYDKLKASSLYLLPVLAAAYFAIAQIWGLPKAEEVVGTVAILETLLGAVLKVSNAQYTSSDARFDGSIVVEPNEAAGHTNLNVTLDPEAVANKNEIVVKIDRQ